MKILLFGHFLGFSVLLSAFFLQRRAAASNGGLTNAWLYGSLVQAVTGLAMVGVIDAAQVDDSGPVPGGLGVGGHIKIGVKLVVLLAIALLAVVGKNRPERARPLSDTMGALTVMNIAIAVFWPG